MKIILLILSLFYFSCNNNSTSVVTDNLFSVRYVDSIIANIDTLCINNWGTELFYEIIDKHKNLNLNQYGFIYILNTECSVCIGSLIHFIQVSLELQEKRPVYVIFNELYFPVINYYLEKVNLDYSHLYFHDSSPYQYFIDISELSGQIFIIHHDKIVGSFFLEK